MPEDARTRELQQAENAFDMIFPAGDEPAGVVEPGKEPLAFPAALHAAERTAVLCAGAAAPMRRNHLDAVPGQQPLVERVAVVAAIANQADREVRGEARARVAATRWPSYGEALATCTARGRPWRSQIANGSALFFAVYVLRPPVASDRLAIASDGRVLVTLRHAWADGTSVVALDPMTFLGRLAVLGARSA